jgi:structural maintenance of chromosome 4
LFEPIITNAETLLNQQSAKNEAEAFMMKEAELYKWQEKASELALQDANTHVTDLQENVRKLEGNLKEEK